ncbi:MAG: hypothetical protein E7371_00400 [Clostridiales bacterium]|nr:hypothetical protein [Clostridiales bacterium]
MKKEENVYDTTEGTEDAMNQNGVENTADKEASAVPDKFKDVDALARAYTALQAEFTRRSQRLKELEKQLDNLDADGDSGAGKLRKNARVRKVENKRFEAFLAETEGRVLGGDSTAEEPKTEQPSNGVQAENEPTMYAMNAVPDTDNGAAKQGEIESQTSMGVSDGKEISAMLGSAQSQGTSVADSERAATDSQTLYTQVSRDENVRLRIIGEYLASLGKSDAPLMRGGVGIMTAPPKKANSISEAGDMALLYLKKPKEL